jgi:hypothetical protein
MALIHQTREAAGTRQHAQQRHFRQAHRGVAIVHQVDLFAGQRQLVATARGNAVARRYIVLPAVRAGVLNGQARFVGVFAEVDLEAVCGSGQHVDVGARAKDAIQAAGDDHRAHFGMLEAQPRHRVGQFDIHAKIVGIELELVAGD